MTPKHIVFFHFFLRDGGVEKLLVKLANEGAQTGAFKAGFVAMDLRGHFLQALDKRVTTTDLGLRPFHLIDHLRCIFSLARLLRQQKPDLIMTGMPAANLTIILAKYLSRQKMQVVISEHGPTSLWIRGRQGGIVLKWALRLAIMLFYRFADVIVTVSDYLIGDLSRFALLSPSRLQRIYNPVIDESLAEKAAQIPAHPWFNPKRQPVILSIGRLAKEKNYDLLLRAFAMARAVRPELKLLLLGDGPERPRLEQRVRDLELNDSVSMPGFEANPYAFLRQADMFVLSSAYEGLSTVLIEALACFCPVIATHSPGGTAEILDHGRYGTLVPVGNAPALRDAMLETLTHPEPAKVRAQAFHAKQIAEFTTETALRHYRQLFERLN